jgi:hypothetical protein
LNAAPRRSLKGNGSSLDTGCIEQIQSIAINNSALTSAHIAIEKKLDEYYQAALKKKCMLEKYI